MHLKLSVTVLPFTLPLLVLAQVPSPPPEVAAQTVQEDHYPPHPVMFPDGVKGMPGVVYWEPTGYRQLTLDLYLPPSNSPAANARLSFDHVHPWWRLDGGRLAS